jgi:aspartyl-tRNA(Asn)/glutamyl-tRNA(Gln) amidotransferase subunit C
MPINEADIKKIATLAHIEITDDELRVFGPQIADIVKYVEQLNAVDTKDVEAATGGLTPEGEATDSAREDEVQECLGQEVALAEAPDAASGHFRVPKIL